jgi:hypothetical protein
MSVTSEREYNRLSGRASSAKRWGHANAAELAAELVAAQLERHIAKVVEDAPPLSPEQIERITAILHAHARPAHKSKPKTAAKRNGKRAS